MTAFSGLARLPSSSGDDQVAEFTRLLYAKRHSASLSTVLVHRAAFDRATTLTQEEPGNAQGWWHLALAAKELKRWEDACNAVKETINLTPRSPVVWGEYGHILSALKRPSEARKAFEMSIKIDPDYEYGRLNLVYICDEAKDYDGVIIHGHALEKIGKANPLIL
jgi:tetratricopeptide (TPR) repeat protein